VPIVLSLYVRIFLFKIAVVMSNRIPLPAGFSDANEIIIWQALICKYMCKEKIDNFRKPNFLGTIISGEIQMPNALDEDELKMAIEDEHHHYSVLIKQCLERMNNNGLLNDEYQKTDMLRVICPEILKYDMPVIEVLIKEIKDAESEIKDDRHLSAIISLLKRLEGGTEINIEEAMSNIDKNTLTKLNQLGIINVSLNDQIAISHVGQLLLKMLHH
jgi:hypothetical protein